MCFFIIQKPTLNNLGKKWDLIAKIRQSAACSFLLRSLLRGGKFEFLRSIFGLISYRHSVVVTKNGWPMGQMWAVYWANTKKKIHNVPEIPSYVHHSCQLAFTKANEDKTKQRIKGCWGYIIILWGDFEGSICSSSIGVCY